MATEIYLEFTDEDYKVFAEFADLDIHERKQHIDDFDAAVALHVAVNQTYNDADFALALQLQEEEQKRVPRPISLAEQKLGQIHHEDAHNYRFYCPYGCGQIIEVSKTHEHDSGVYCGIFHCGKMADGTTIPQHASDAQVEQWRKEGKLKTRCGYQFKMTKTRMSYIIEKCNNL